MKKYFFKFSQKAEKSFQSFSKNTKIQISHFPLFRSSKHKEIFRLKLGDTKLGTSACFPTLPPVFKFFIFALSLHCLKVLCLKDYSVLNCQNTAKTLQMSAKKLQVMQKNARIFSR